MSTRAPFLIRLGSNGNRFYSLVTRRLYLRCPCRRPFMVLPFEALFIAVMETGC